MFSINYLFRKNDYKNVHYSGETKYDYNMKDVKKFYLKNLKDYKISKKTFYKYRYEFFFLLNPTYTDIEMSLEASKFCQNFLKVIGN